MIQGWFYDFQCRRSDTFAFANGCCTGRCSKCAGLGITDLRCRSRSGYCLRCGAGDCPFDASNCPSFALFCSSYQTRPDLVLHHRDGLGRVGWPAIHAGQHHFVRLVQWRNGGLHLPCPAHYWHFDDDLDGLQQRMDLRRRGTNPPGKRRRGFP